MEMAPNIDCKIDPFGDIGLIRKNTQRKVLLRSPTFIGKLQ